MSPPGVLESRLRELSALLQRIHAAILEVEKEFDPTLTGWQGVNRLANDPAWSWLRKLSALIADIDHVLAQKQPVTEYEVAAVGAEVRSAVFGTGDAPDQLFLERYRPLLQQSTGLMVAHGELKLLLESFPQEAGNESERLHARHVWAERCKQRIRRR